MLLWQQGHWSLLIHPQTHPNPFCLPDHLSHQSWWPSQWQHSSTGDNAGDKAPSVCSHGRCSRMKPPRWFRQAAWANCAFHFQQWPVSDSGWGKCERFYIRICALKEKGPLYFIRENLAGVLRHKGVKCYQTPWTKPLTLREAKENFLLSSLDNHFHLSGFAVWGFVSACKNSKIPNCFRFEQEIKTLCFSSCCTGKTLLW